MKPANVALGYLHPGEVAACFMDSMFEMYMYDAQMHQRLMHPHGKMGKRAGSGGIVDARNQLTKIMLDESECDWLMMIDADMGFAHDTLERMIDSAHARQRPVMGALCFAYAQDRRKEFFGATWRAVPTLYDWVEEDEETVGFMPRMKYYEDGGVQECSATGAACVLIHRRVLEKVRDKFGDNEWWEPIKHPAGRKFSEDLSFCVRVAAVDEPMFVNTAVKTTHYKGAVYYDEEYYLAQQAIRGEL